MSDFKWNGAAYNAPLRTTRKSGQNGKLRVWAMRITGAKTPKRGPGKGKFTTTVIFPPEHLSVMSVRGTLNDTPVIRLC